MKKRGKAKKKPVLHQIFSRFDSLDKEMANGREF